MSNAIHATDSGFCNNRVVVNVDEHYAARDVVMLPTSAVSVVHTLLDADEFSFDNFSEPAA